MRVFNKKSEPTWTAKHIPIINFWFFQVIYNCGNSIMGRCGGGWLFSLGIKGGSSSVAIELTFITIRIQWKKYKILL